MPTKTKGVTKKKAKSAVKKGTKNPVKKTTRSVVKKKTTAAVINKAKKPVSNKTKSAAKKRITKKVRIVSVKKAVKGKTKPVARQPVALQKIAHGKDQHFIPAHGKVAPVTIHDSKKEETLFHNREEVAIQQENQKVKAGMAGRMGRKRIFRMPGRG